MAKLAFKASEILALYAHASAAEKQRISFSHLAEKSLLKDGEKMPARGWSEQDQIDQSKIKPHLLLVKDQGCYLMSGGLPAFKGTESANAVAYAEGLGPDCDWDELRHACGGDDFAEPLPLEMFKPAIDASSSTIFVHLNKTTIRISWK